MDLLKKEDGFSIIETLTSIVILGLLIAFTAMIIKGLYYYPKGLLKNESLMLASNEMDRTINNNILSDTCYNNLKGSLQVSRTVVQEDSLLSITVLVKFSQTEEEILRLHAYKQRGI